MLMGQAISRPDIPCTTCDKYLERVHIGDWVVRSPLKTIVNAHIQRIRAKVDVLRFRRQLGSYGGAARRV